MFNLFFGEWKIQRDTEKLVVAPKSELRWENVKSLVVDEQCRFDEVCVAKVLDNLSVNETASFYYLNQDGHVRQIAFGALPTEASRNNCPARPDSISDIIQRSASKKADISILIIVDHSDYAFAAGCAVARCFPLYTRKTAKDASDNSIDRNVYVSVHCLKGQKEVPYDHLKHASEGIRLAARFTDMPTLELNCDSYVKEILDIASDLPNVKMTAIRGSELRDKGFGGLWNVGKASSNAPALVILSYTPINPLKEIALVGKGIMYDTGGLSIKDRLGMIGMKRDMGGSASVLGAFQAAVRNKVPHTLHAVLCIAENSINERATRPDDIIELYSGKTVEVNNPDAEGRLVLGDGVAYVTKHFSPDVVIDMATLTGAQAIITGKRHAAVLCNNVEYEQRVVKAGIRSGDLVFPILYCPEFLKKEFKSELADMKNSVKDRSNAQSSCAGHFIEDHLHPNYKGVWCHIDIAEPVSRDERGTGFGVALLLQLLSEVQ